VCAVKLGSPVKDFAQGHGSEAGLHSGLLGDGF
jgi:hypothetical protein